MVDSSRRHFLQQISAAAVVLAAGRGIPSFGMTADEQYRMLVVGDSFIWGQGLEEKDKFYQMTKEWIESGTLGTARKVDLKIKAHSGATLKFHSNESDAFRKAGRDETFLYPPEINVGFPSISKQIETAADEYRKDGSTADLILLCGGITDISVAKLLDPFGDDSVLPGQIAKYCRDDMYEVLKDTTVKFPKALIAVVGYFPIISPQTPRSKLFNIWLESMAIKRPLKPLINNSMMRSMFFGKIYKKAITRSRIWFDESNKSLKESVARLNESAGTTRAVFVMSPITEDTCIETPNTLLFRMGKKGRSEDGLYDYRLAECPKHLGDLKEATGLKYPVRYCEIAGVGHPNPAGSRAYAEAIETTIAPHIK